MYNSELQQFFVVVEDDLKFNMLHIVSEYA